MYWSSKSEHKREREREREKKREREAGSQQFATTKIIRLFYCKLFIIEFKDNGNTNLILLNRST